MVSSTATSVRSTHDGNTFLVKEPGTIKSTKKDAAAFASLLEKPQPGCNALDLKNLTRADESRFTRWQETVLLRTLVNNRAGPGKNEGEGLSDMSSCLEFNVIGTHSSFSGAHVDGLPGTWLRVLTGTKLWFIPDDMSPDDWEAFGRLGPDWIPAGPCKIIVLEPDDVLVMRSGTPVVHAAMSLDLCILQGGMFWEFSSAAGILESLRWIAENQLATNEELALQLPDVIERLVQLLDSSPELFTTHLSQPDHDAHIQDLRALAEDMWNLGCACKAGCRSSCPCELDGRRCLPWCAGHSKKGKGQMRACMKIL
ncbi:hypothetical protein KVT40_009106 [Elsinoe batatas]|uniref:JmjC domain-containing protein n=1 Tax=Elsinoe batatas TaxID=2601811 RepID=A0A8K0KYB3_9PEZI|nr:hypothetical protein KVT40_009106 [Elsinoe batatas]